MKEQAEISLYNEHEAGEPNVTYLGKITKMWLTDQRELGIKTDLAFRLSIKLTKADMDQFKNQLNGMGRVAKAHGKTPQK
ncbi:hypothetical protein ES705_36892 [subsurface metagenome]|jgi:hypothetical protein